MAAQQLVDMNMTVSRLEKEADAAAAAASSDVVREGSAKTGLTQLQRAYKRQVTEMYEVDEEVASSCKRKKTAPADDDTKVVKHRCTCARVTPTSADTSQDHCDSPPAGQEIPWGPLYEDVSDDDVIASSPAHDDDEDAIASSPAHEDDDDFTFSPASPPLTQRTEDERATSAPRTLYVFPDETVVLKPDGGCVRIADQHTITQPQPSTSNIEDDDDDDEDEPAADQARKVCFMKMEKTIAQIITNQWWATTPSTEEEVSVDVCQALAATMLSAAFQEIMMAYARSNIRLDSRRL